MKKTFRGTIPRISFKPSCDFIVKGWDKIGGEYVHFARVSFKDGSSKVYKNGQLVTEKDFKNGIGI